MLNSRRKKIRILFEMGMPSFLRHFENIINKLKSKYDVVVTTIKKEGFGLVEKQIAELNHRELLHKTAMVRDDEWSELSYAIQCAHDCIPYLTPNHTKSTIIKKRILNMLEYGTKDKRGDIYRTLSSFLATVESPEQVDSLDKLFRSVHAIVPPSHKTIQKLNEISPDIVCITPLVYTCYGQTELIRAAKAMNIPIIFLANSWDNLSTKGIVHIIPDYTFVWNNVQAKEAVEFHGVSAETIRNVGASRFDDFIMRRPEINRADFCKQFRLDPEKPVITYLCSSNLISADETRFVHEWISRIRNSPDQALSGCNIMIRPHPKFRGGWESFNDLPGTAVCLSSILNNDPLLYHSLFYARVVVGINTSAELEAAIVGKPVLTVKDSLFSSGQEGTIHYTYLLKENGGFVEEARNMDEHLAQLAAELSREDDPERNNKFVESFLRPQGIDKNVSDIVETEISSCFKNYKKQKSFVNG